MAVMAWMLAAPPLHRPELPDLRHETAMELRGLLASSLHADLRWPEFSAYRTQVTKFYSSLGYALAWTEDGLPTAVSRAVIEALIASGSKGLDPEDYDGPRWSLRLLELQKHGASPRDLARFDLSLTISAMRYVSDLCAGKVNPKLLHPDFRLTHDSLDPASFVRERLLPADNPDSSLRVWNRRLTAIAERKRRFSSTVSLRDKTRMNLCRRYASRSNQATPTVALRG